MLAASTASGARQAGKAATEKKREREMKLFLGCYGRAMDGGYK
jgi:hypothetical protein